MSPEARVVHQREPRSLWLQSCPLQRVGQALGLCVGQRLGAWGKIRGALGEGPTRGQLTCALRDALSGGWVREAATEVPNPCARYPLSSCF